MQNIRMLSVRMGYAPDTCYIRPLRDNPKVKGFAFDLSLGHLMTRFH